MKNQIELAKTAISRLNELYKENIFELKYGSTTESATIINDKYRHEGNDVDVVFDDEGIKGSATGATVKFSSLDDLVQNIDQLFINEEIL